MHWRTCPVFTICSIQCTYWRVPLCSQCAVQHVEYTKCTLAGARRWQCVVQNAHYTMCTLVGPRVHNATDLAFLLLWGHIPTLDHTYKLDSAATFPHLPSWMCLSPCISISFLTRPRWSLFLQISYQVCNHSPKNTNFDQFHVPNEIVSSNLKDV